jgi:hypothetical protein
MKRLLNTLRLVWKLFRLFSLLRTAWEFIRDHWDECL